MSGAALYINIVHVGAVREPPVLNNQKSQIKQKEFSMKKLVLIFTILLPISCFATLKLVPANQGIKDLNTTLNVLQQHAKSSIPFPSQIPLDTKHKNYFAFGEVTNSGYIISIDNSAECEGVHYCNVGSMLTSTGDNPQIYYDMQNKELTMPVKLAHGQKAYYTPGHAMGDYWPPMLEWRHKKQFYRLTWRLPNDVAKKYLIGMANKML